MDPTTGDALTAEESEDFQRCLQRQKERRHTRGGGGGGGQADELVKPTAKINPNKSMLERKQRHGGDSTQTAKLRNDPNQVAKDKKKEKKKKKQDNKEKTKKTEKHDTVEVADLAEDSNTQQDETAAGDPDQEDVD